MKVNKTPHGTGCQVGLDDGEANGIFSLEGEPFWRIQRAHNRLTGTGFLKHALSSRTGRSVTKAQIGAFLNWPLKAVRLLGAVLGNLLSGTGYSMKIA